MPAAPPEMLLPTTLASLLARSGPKMEMPTSPERLMSLERILVPVESKITVPTEVLSVMSLLERILVPVDLTTSIEVVVREVVARDGGVGAPLDKDPTVGAAFDIVP